MSFSPRGRRAKSVQPFALPQSCAAFFTGVFSLSPTPTSANSNPASRVRVWDLPTRIFHWALAFCFVGSVSSALVFGNMLVHFRFGYAVLALLLFRLVWGLVGGHWSRFSSFLPSPLLVWRYVRDRNTVAGPGHSPLGALAVWAMLLLLAAQVGSGLMSDDEIAFSGPLSSLVPNAWVSLATSFHARIGKLALLGLVALHLLAIVFYAKRGQALAAAMLHGDKALTAPGGVAVAVQSSRDDWRTRLAALAVALVCAGAAYWVASLEAPSF